MALKRLIRKISVICLLLFILACTSFPALSSVSKIPITQKGKMSTVVLALVNRQNTIFDGEQGHTFPGGLEFYFIIYPLTPNVDPTIKQYQNFAINKEPYWQNVPGSYDSYTVIFNERTFAEYEPKAFSKINIRKNSKFFVQKTTICGPPLPSEGIVTYLLFFGFGETLEEFEFRFNLMDVP